MRSVTMKAVLLGCGAAVLAVSGPAVAQETPRATAYESVAKWPDWSGVWSPGVGAGSRTTPTPPKLTPAAQARLDAFNAGKERGENLQTQAANCVPNGMPGIMRLPYPIEFTYSPGRVNILIETYSEIRRIYIDRELPEDPDPFFNGSSVGHWEDGVLVVETVGFSPETFIAPGLQHSDKMKIVERIYLVNPKLLIDEITITDPEVLAAPYVMRIPFKPDTVPLREYVCAENNRLKASENGANIDLEDDPFADQKGQ